jgi:ribulose-phosphate 3-epimerase
MVKIEPSILSADFSKLGTEIKEAEEAGADIIHIDVMDGSFVPNLTVGPLVVEAVRPHTQLPLDVHLMIEEPDRYIEAFVKAGANIITIHVEASRHLHRSLNWIRESGVKAGVSVNPATHLYNLDFVLSEVDIVLIMSVNPGFGGQSFIPSTIKKIRQMRELLNEEYSQTEIEVDGGVKVDNARQIVEAGADILVMGSAFFNSSNYRETISLVRGQVNGASRYTL